MEGVASTVAPSLLTDTAAVTWAEPTPVDVDIEAAMDFAEAIALGTDTQDHAHSWDDGPAADDAEDKDAVSTVDRFNAMRSEETSSGV